MILKTYLPMIQYMKIFILAANMTENHGKVKKWSI